MSSAATRITTRPLPDRTNTATPCRRHGIMDDFPIAGEETARPSAKSSRRPSATRMLLTRRWATKAWLISAYLLPRVNPSTRRVYEVGPSNQPRAADLHGHAKRSGADDVLTVTHISRFRIETDPGPAYCPTRSMNRESKTSKWIGLIQWPRLTPRPR
jgi:hypothetical protein